MCGFSLWGLSFGILGLGKNKVGAYPGLGLFPKGLSDHEASLAWGRQKDIEYLCIFVLQQHLTPHSKDSITVI